jgi:methylphosphotriester-DNA--protein-cysteine methyltransferase
MGMRPTRRCQDDTRVADKIAMALVLIEEADQRWTGLARHLAHTGMDRDEELVRRLVARAERMAQGGRRYRS